MENGAYNQREACLVVALNILTGALKPENWRGLRRLDEDDEFVLNQLHDIRQWGFGKLEINVVDHKIETAYKGNTFKRKDFSRANEGA